MNTVAFALLLGAPTSAADLTPVGQWELASGESRYRVSYCGDGTELCARLTWLRNDVRTDANLAMLDTNVLRGTRSDLANEWSGLVIYEGQTYRGRLTLTSNTSMILHTCSGFLCQSQELNRR